MKALFLINEKFSLVIPKKSNFIFYKRFVYLIIYTLSYRIVI